MGLMCQVPHPFRFRYGFALPMSGLSPNDDSLNSGKVYHANLIKHIIIEPSARRLNQFSQG